MRTIAQRIAAYPRFLGPLKEVAHRYLKQGSALNEDGILHIGHRLWVAELNYVLTLYPGITPQALDRYCRRFGLQIPELYTAFLREVNGAFCFGMSLYGVPLSMLRRPPLLERSAGQCHDLATAVREWANEYRAPAACFHFGSRQLSHEENAGYFIEGNTRIVSIRAGGERVGEWDDFRAFFSDELAASEALEEELYPPRRSKTAREAKARRLR